MLARPNKVTFKLFFLIVQEMQKKLEETEARLSKERDAAKSLLEQTEKDLSSKLKSAADECERMQRILQQSKEGLGSASSHIENLQQTNSRLKTELESTQKELRESKSKSLSISVSLTCVCVVYFLSFRGKESSKMQC